MDCSNSLTDEGKGGSENKTKAGCEEKVVMKDAPVTAEEIKRALAKRRKS